MQFGHFLKFLFIKTMSVLEVETGTCKVLEDTKKKDASESSTKGCHVNNPGFIVNRLKRVKKYQNGPLMWKYSDLDCLSSLDLTFICHNNNPPVPPHRYVRLLWYRQYVDSCLSGSGLDRFSHKKEKKLQEYIFNKRD